MSLQQQNLNAQIIQVLCHSTLQFNDILHSLQTRFPASNWSSNLLNTFLSLGTKQGRLVQVTFNPQRWQVRRDMAYVFPTNQIYQNLCETILPRYDCTTR
jgi:hypothetical protein